MNKLKIGNLTVQTPIIQGGMGVGVSLSGLASAVANEGGIGVISAVGIGMTEPVLSEKLRFTNKGSLCQGAFVMLSSWLGSSFLASPHISS